MAKKRPTILTRPMGVLVCVFGIVIFLLNFLTYGLWKIDIDILGAIIFVLGLVMIIACGKNMKNSSELLSRKNGVWLCVIAVAMTAIFGYSSIPVLNGDIGGFIGLGLFVFGLILITVRWKN